MDSRHSDFLLAAAENVRNARVRYPQFFALYRRETFFAERGARVLAGALQPVSQSRTAASWR